MAFQTRASDLPSSLFSKQKKLISGQMEVIIFYRSPKQFPWPFWYWRNLALDEWCQDQGTMETSGAPQWSPNISLVLKIWRNPHLYKLGCPPPQDASHHQDYYICLGSVIPINLHLLLLLGGGTTQYISCMDTAYVRETSTPKIAKNKVQESFRWERYLKFLVNWGGTCPVFLTKGCCRLAIRFFVVCTV